MKKPIQITIPTPCHENWQQMTAVEKGRFCASCEKKVFDFTNSSDREIAAVLKNTDNSCGRFRSSQLNRDLIVPTEKSTLWIAASAAVISFLTIGTNRVLAQEPVATEQHIINIDKTIKNNTINQSRTITGTVLEDKIPLPEVIIINKNSNKETVADFDGKFNIEATIGDILTINYVGYSTKEVIIGTENNIIILVEPEFHGLISEPRRTFFGRVFHSIGNIFK